jgi:hypothetical protein
MKGATRVPSVVSASIACDSFYSLRSGLRWILQLPHLPYLAPVPAAPDLFRLHWCLLTIHSYMLSFTHSLS